MNTNVKKYKSVNDIKENRLTEFEFCLTAYQPL